MSEQPEREKAMPYLVRVLHENAERNVTDEIPVPLGRLLEILYAWQAAVGKPRGWVERVIAQVNDEATPTEYALMVYRAEKAEAEVAVLRKQAEK